MLLKFHVKHFSIYSVASVLLDSIVALQNDIPDCE